MAKQVDAGQMASAWQAGMARSAGKYKEGVSRVTENPMAKAAAKVADGTWAANTAAAAPRLQSALAQADFGFWKSQASGPGAAAWAASASKGLPKYQRKAAALAAAASAASSAADAATGPLEKVRAAINAFKTAFGKSPI